MLASTSSMRNRWTVSSSAMLDETFRFVMGPSVSTKESKS